MRKVIAFFIALLPFLGTASARNVYLLAVGISDYPGTRNDLRLPAKDAQAIYELYGDYTSGGFALLLNSDATVQRIKARAAEMFAKANKDDIVIFFFSGHGLSNGAFMAYDKALYYDEVKALFSSCRASNKMIFADSCFSGQIRGSGNSSHSSTRSSDNSSSNVMMFLSSRSNEVSREQARMRNGYFTACLLRSLKGAADSNRDRIITAKELFEAVAEGVKTLSQNRQHPVMWGNFRDDMPVFVWK